MEKVKLPPRICYSIPEVCRLTGISRSFIYKEWACGRGLRRFKAGSRTLVRAKALEDWIRSLERGER